MNIVNKRSHLALGHPSEVGTHDGTNMGNSIIPDFIGEVSMVIVTCCMLLNKILHGFGTVFGLIIMLSRTAVLGGASRNMVTT